jgi:hypothetical protein
MGVEIREKMIIKPGDALFDRVGWQEEFYAELACDCAVSKSSRDILGAKRDIQ